MECRGRQPLCCVKTGSPVMWWKRLLAHQERSSVVAAYTHAEYADDRRKALQWLADRIDKITT